MRRRRNDRWAPPPPGGSPPTEPVEEINLYPNPLPPPRPPITRDSILVDLQTGFASLTEDELRLARLWLCGDTFEDVCDYMRLSEKEVRGMFRCVRRKLRGTLRPPIRYDSPPASGVPDGGDAAG